MIWHDYIRHQKQRWWKSRTRAPFTSSTLLIPRQDASATSWWAKEKGPSTKYSNSFKKNHHPPFGNQNHPRSPANSETWSQHDQTCYLLQPKKHLYIIANLFWYVLMDHVGSIRCKFKANLTHKTKSSISILKPTHGNQTQGWAGHHLQSAATLH